MASFHDALAAPAVALLVDHFGERGPGGEFAQLKYFDPRIPNAQPKLFRGFHTDTRVQLVELDDGGLGKKETRVWTVERALLDAAAIPHLQANATFEDDAGQWEFNPDQSKWGESFVDFGMMRTPRVAGEDLTGAAV